MKKIYVLSLVLVLCFSFIFAVFTGMAVGEDCILFEDSFDAYSDSWDFSDEKGIPLSFEDSPWKLEDGYLGCEDHFWANTGSEEWTDYVFETRVKIVKGTVHINFRKSFEGRYFLGLQENNSYLVKETPWGTFYDLVHTHELNFELNKWYDLRIEVNENNIKVNIGDSQFVFTDINEPLLKGAIAFESLDNSVVYFDDVSVNGDCVIEEICNNNDICETDRGENNLNCGDDCWCGNGVCEDGEDCPSDCDFFLPSKCNFKVDFLQCTDIDINSEGIRINAYNSFSDDGFFIEKPDFLFMGRVGGEGPDCLAEGNQHIFVDRESDFEIYTPCDVISDYVGKSVELKLHMEASEGDGDTGIIEADLQGTVRGIDSEIECGNGICESGEDEYNCPEDCLLDGETYFKEDEEFLYLGNDYLEFVFDKESNGGLYSFRNKVSGDDFIQAKENSRRIFSVQKTRTEGELLFDNFAMSDFSYGISEIEDGKVLTLTSLNEEYETIVNIKISVYENFKLADWRIYIENSGEESVNIITFPYIQGFSKIGDSSADDYIVYPRLGSGLLVNNPLDVFEPYPNPVEGFGARYPGDGLQMMAFYDDNGGFYFSTEDSDMHVKFFDGWIDGEEVISTSITHHFPEEYAVNGDVDFSLPYNVKVGVFQGDWYGAADIYKKWAREQWWTEKKVSEKDSPRWLLDYPSVLQFYNYPRGEIYELEDIVKRTNHFSEEIGVPMVSLIQGWENNSAKTYVPYYYPPSEGEENFRNAMDALVNKGNKGLIYISASLVSGAKEDDIAYDYAIIDEDGGYQFSEWARGAFGMDPSTGFWQETITDTVLTLSDLGVDFIQLDGMPQGGGLMPCYSEEHGHPIGYGNWIGIGWIELLDKVRIAGKKANPDFTMSAEEMSEIYIPYLDTYVSRDNAPDFNWQTNIPFDKIDNWKTIPLFTYIYSPYITTFGQFVVSQYGVARGFVRGKLQHVSGNINIDSENDIRPYELFKKASSITNEYVKEYFLYGEMLKPQEIDVPIIATKGSGFAGGGSVPYSEFNSESVMHSVWGYNGKIAYLFVNIADENIEFDIELSSYNLGNSEYNVYSIRDGLKTLEHEDISLPILKQISIEPNQILIYEITSESSPEPPDETEGILIFEDDFEDGLHNKWVDATGGVNIFGEIGNYYIKMNGFAYYWSDDAYYPASISSKYFFLDDYKIKFKLKIEEDGMNLNFKQNIDYSTYFLNINLDYASLSRSGEWGKSEQVGESDLELEKGKWYDVEIRDKNGDIQILIDDNLIIEYQDDNPLYPGKLSFITTAEDTLFYFDDVEVFNTDPSFSTDYNIEVDVSQEEDLERVYECATLWTKDMGTIPFKQDGPTADKLKEVDLKYMRIRAVGDAGWLGGGVIVTKNHDGTLDIDFSNLDETVKSIKAMGKEPYMRLGWEMPKDLADKECSKIRNYWTCPPEDYSDWEEIVYQIVKHYNIDNAFDIKYWVVWNEPDIEEYGGDEEKGLRNLQNYLKLYEASVKGALRADPSIKIGGPTIANSCGNGPIFGESCFWHAEWEPPVGGFEFADGLLKFCSENDIRLDLLVFHRYGFYHPKYYSNLIEEMGSLAHSYGLYPELVLDEWTLWEYPQNEKTAAYAASSIHYQMDSDLRLSCYTSFNGFGDESKPANNYPSGFGLAMVDGRVVKSPYFVFKMYSMLEDIRLDVKVDDGLSVSDDDSIGAVSARDDDSVQVLIWRYDDLDIEKSIDLKIKNLETQFPGVNKVNVKGYLIDETHSNPYNYYVVDNNDNNGGMYNLETAQLDQVIESEETISNGEVSISTDLEGYSVLLLTLEPSGGTSTECNGCFKNKICYPYGIRDEGKYCDVSGEFVKQKKGDKGCENNFECKTNICINDKCVSKGVWEKFLEWFKKFFD